MSISLIVDGRLWGLIACHHGRPIRPDLSTRTLAALMGRLYSLALSRIERQGLDRNIRSLLLTPPGVEPLVIPGSSASVAESVCARLAALYEAAIGLQPHNPASHAGLAYTRQLTGEFPVLDMGQDFPFGEGAHRFSQLPAFGCGPNTHDRIVSGMST